MKKTPILLLISIISISGLSLKALALPEGFYGKNTKSLNTTGYVCSSNYVNLRKTPSLSGKIMTSVPRDSLVWMDGKKVAREGHSWMWSVVTLDGSGNSYNGWLSLSTLCDLKTHNTSVK